MDFRQILPYGRVRTARTGNGRVSGGRGGMLVKGGADAWGGTSRGAGRVSVHAMSCVHDKTCRRVASRGRAIWCCHWRTFRKGGSDRVSSRGGGHGALKFPIIFRRTLPFGRRKSALGWVNLSAGSATGFSRLMAVFRFRESGRPNNTNNFNGNPEPGGRLRERVLARLRQLSVFRRVTY